MSAINRSILAALATGLLGCSSGGVTVTISPVTVTVTSGQTQQFSAQVKGESPDVLWTVMEATGGTVTAGGLYTAPSTTGTYHVTATSKAHPTSLAQASVTVPGTSGLAYANPPGTGWRLVRNTALSSPNHLVLDLVGATGATGRGIALNLSADSTKVSWSRVASADVESVQNHAFNLGSGALLAKGTVKADALLVGLFQKGGTLAPAALDVPVLSVAVDLAAGERLAKGTTIPLAVTKSMVLPASGALAAVVVDVGSLSAQ